MASANTKHTNMQKTHATTMIVKRNYNYNSYFVRLHRNTTWTASSGIPFAQSTRSAYIASVPWSDVDRPL